MTLRIEIGAEGDPFRTFYQDDLFATNPVWVHTGVSDMDFTVPFDASLRDFFFEDVRLYDNERLLFRGEIHGFDWSDRDGRTRLSCKGIENDLSNQSVDRQFTNTFTHNALQTIFDQDTDFDITVFDPPIESTVTDEEAWSADTDAEFSDRLSIPDTVPLTIRNDGVETTPTALWDEAEALDITQGTNGVDPDPNASGGEAVGLYGTGDEFALEFEVEHTIPGEDVHYGFRYRVRDDVDGDGNFEGPAFSVSVDGTEINSFGGGTAPFTTGDDTYDWFTTTVGQGDFDPGTHEIRWVVEDDSYEDADGNIIHTGVTYIDVAVIIDDRYATTNPDNTTDSNDALSSPTAHPDGVQQAFDLVNVDYNVTGISADTTWNTTARSQALSVATTSSNWQTAANTSTIDKSFSTPSVQVYFRATWTWDTNDATTTPSQGDAPGRLDAVTVRFDGNGQNVLDDQQVQGDALSVAQQLCERSGYRFVIDHAATDGSGNLIKAGEAFERGDQTRQADWTVLDRNPSESADRYANRVRIRGALQDDGTRPTAVIQDDSEVAQFGVRLFEATRPDISSVDAAIGQARGELLDRVQREVEGTQTTPPQSILPGYRYEGLDWFDDGDLRATDLDRVELTEEYQDARTRLVFGAEQDIVEKVVDTGYQIAQTKQGV